MTFPIATVDDLLRVWRDGMSPDYAHGLEFEDDGRGWDPIVGQAAILARVASAIGVTSQAYYLRPHSTQIAPEASGARYAVGTVTLTRTPPANGPIQLDIGTQIVALVHDVTGELIEGSTYELTTPVAFGPGDVGPYTAAVKCLRVGYQGNIPDGRQVAFVQRGRLAVPGTVIAADTIIDTVGLADRFVASLPGRYVRLVGGSNSGTFPRRVTSATMAFDPSTTPNQITVDGPALVLGPQPVEVEELEDIGLEVELSSALVDGRHGWLDAIGEERLCYRQVGEDDAAYLARILTLIDVVSPGAIVRACSRILTPAGISWQFHEASEPLTVSGYLWWPGMVDAGAGAWVPISVDLSTRVRYFVIVVGINGLGDLGTQWDVYQGATDDNDYDGDAFSDGFPWGWDATLQALYVTLSAIKAAGIAWQIIIDPTLPP